MAMQSQCLPPHPPRPTHIATQHWTLQFNQNNWLGPHASVFRCPHLIGVLNDIHLIYPRTQESRGSRLHYFDLENSPLNSSTRPGHIPHNLHVQDAIDSASFLCTFNDFVTVQISMVMGMLNLNGKVEPRAVSL